MLALVVKWLAIAVSCALGGVVVSVIAGHVARKTAKEICAGGVACVFVAIVAIIYGGTKNLLLRFTSDSGLHVVEATMNRATNEVDSTYLTVKWTGPDESAPINVRDSVHDRWANIGFIDEGWMYDDRFYENGTNTVFYWIDPGVAASNATVWTYWHLGTDLPPIEVDGDGVTVEDFSATSKQVTIRYAVNPAALGANGNAVSIEVQRGDSSVWNEVYRLSISAPATNTVQFSGFYVGEDTRWRVRLEVSE